jgi:diaminopropionate ammonia-lyase
MWIANAAASRSSYPAALKAILNIESTEESREWLTHWSRLNRDATPLWELPNLAAQLRIQKLCIKDESARSPIGSFKALGAPIALARLIRRLKPKDKPSVKALFAGRCRESLRQFAVIAATDGNHGRALAAAAHDIGCRCVIVLHGHVNPEREQAIAAYGAEIRRIGASYDDSVKHAAQLAAANGWHVISDTSYDGYENIPRDVMQGYGIIAAEVIEQTHSQPHQPAFTHVFLQGGVGGLAAAIVSYIWEFHGRYRPRFIVVEPRQADCLYQSAVAGKATRATGTIHSIMAGLACGEASALAWKILQSGVDGFLTIDDDDAVEAMRTLAAVSAQDIPIVAGESGAAGLAGLTFVSEDARLAKAVDLNENSRVLLINTEGATAPSVYRNFVGEAADSVLRRQTATYHCSCGTPLPAD